MLNLWTTEQFEIICESSLLPPVSQFLKECKERPEGGKREGRPCSISQGWHLKYTTRNELLWYTGSRSHKGQNILPHSCFHAWEVGFGHRGHIAFRDAPGTWRGDVHHPTDPSQVPELSTRTAATTLLQWPKPPSNSGYSSPCYLQQHSLKRTWKELQSCCKYQPLKYRDGVHWSKYMIESI